MKPTFLKGIFLSLAVAACGNCFSQPADAVQDEEAALLASINITEASDWVMTLDERMLDYYLNYPGSLLHPISSVKVTYRTKSPTGSIWGQGQNYEEFWFNNGTTIGLRRTTNVVPPPDSYGLLVIRPLTGAVTDTRALINTAIHLMLEIEVHNNGLIGIVAPRNLCEKASSDLGTFKFFPIQRVKGGQQVLLLHLVSYPEGFDKYYYYASGNPPL